MMKEFRNLIADLVITAVVALVPVGASASRVHHAHAYRPRVVRIAKTNGFYTKRAQHNYTDIKLNGKRPVLNKYAGRRARVLSGRRLHKFARSKQNAFFVGDTAYSKRSHKAEYTYVKSFNGKVKGWVAVSGLNW